MDKNGVEPQELQNAATDDIPPEIMIKIFERLSFEDKVSVSQVCPFWAQIAKNLPALRFIAWMDNESLKFIAERFCPLDLLRIENWSSILREDFSIQQLLTPVNKLELGEGISRYNMNLLLQSEGGSVKNLTIYMRFFALRTGVFTSNPHHFKWYFLETFNIEIPGGKDPADKEHLIFMTNLFSNASLPCLTDLGVEVGRKIGTDASRINRNGRFYPNTLTPLIEGIFKFVAAHGINLKNLKLYFILNVYSEDGETVSVPECSTELGEKLSQLNLTKVQIRFYFDDRHYKVPFVRHILNGATHLVHLEFELFCSIHPEIYTSIKRNENSLQTVVLETRTDKNPCQPWDDIFECLNFLKNCTKLKTLHLRGNGSEVINLVGLPASISTLRICCHESVYAQNQALGSLLIWIRDNLPKLEHMEFGEIGMGEHVEFAAFSAENVLSRNSDFISSRAMTFNWFGDYLLPEPADSFLEC